jgi:chlorite dismutase/DNA-binding Lrp family transcriptional regulator/nitrite reductase/ring-hydroxylating ferredoxin subunit
MTQPTPTKPVRRQYVRFSFFKVDPAWQRLDTARRAADMAEFIAAVEHFQGRMLLRSYTLVGLRGDSDFLLWQVTEDLTILREFATRLNQTRLAPYLHLPHAFLSMTRRSIYTIPDAAGDDSDRITIAPGPAKYLFVYPFVKTRPWYALGKDQRQAMMDEHIRVGRKYPQVKINTTYSYGLDDQEFVVAFETDDAPAFLDLVAELRETEASMYTLRDTPMFTCEAIGLREMLLAVGGVQAKNQESRHEGREAAEAYEDGKNGTRNDTESSHTSHAMPRTSREIPRSDLPASSEDGPWQPVVALAELPPGTNRLIYLDGEAVALWNIGGQVYATNNRCTHARGSLCEGDLAGTVVTCAWHGGQFDLRTGAAVGGPARIPVATYATRITPTGMVEITMSQPADQPASQPAQAGFVAESPIGAGSPAGVAATSEDLDAIDKKLLNLVQWSFPLTERPFQALADAINADLSAANGGGPLTEAEVMARVERLRQRTIIRQLSAIFDTRKLGYISSLVAAHVAPEHLDEAALIVNEHPGVSHNYQRDNHFNLWFTLAVPPAEDLDAVLAALMQRAGVAAYRKLPNLRMYKIAVKLDMERDERDITRKDDAPHYEKNPRALTARDQVLIRAIQRDLPTRANFFDEAAAEAGVTVPELFAWMDEMTRLGYLRRFAAILRHQEAGFTANGMITWKIPEDQVDAIGFQAAAYPQVSHCYRRPVYPDWPYNLFSMVHARSREACEEIARRMSAENGMTEYIILYSTHEYKKTRVEYFANDWDAWRVAGGEGPAWAALEARIAAGEFRDGPTTWRERHMAQSALG